MGRLKPGTTREQAAAQLRASSPGLFAATGSSRAYPPAIKLYKQFTLDAVPGEQGISELRERFRLSLLLLLAIAALSSVDRLRQRRQSDALAGHGAA